MTYGRPGVYFNETSNVPAPIINAGNANAAGAAIGAFANGPTGITLVRSFNEFTTIYGSLNASYPATLGVREFFLNGGSELYIKRILADNAVQASVDVPDSDTGTLGTISSINKGTDGNNLRVRVSATNVTNYYNITVYREVLAQYLNTSNANAANDIIVEQFNSVVFNDANSVDYWASVINSTSSYIVASNAVTGTPATQTVAEVLPLTGGDNGDAPLAADYTAVLPADGSSEFDAIDRPLVIFAPNIYEKFVVDGDSDTDAKTHMATVHDQLIGWADAGIGFAVIDTAPSLTVADAIAYLTARTVSSNAAGYYPNYYIQDPLARSPQALRKVSPAGAIVGIYLSTDKASNAGPAKTPAGITARVNSAVSLERAFTPSDLDSLNSGVYVDALSTTHYGTAVNAIRNIPGAGVVVMGGRTLNQDGTANRYINTRRTISYLKKQLQNLTQFAVFQNNDPGLWAQLNTRISVFLNEFRNQGGLRGGSPSEAYFVQINSTNNTAETIASGVVNITVGVALNYASEFIVINLSQITGQ